MNVFTKIMSDGSTLRKSRLHDEKGNFIPWNNLLTHIVPAATSTLLRITIGHRPEQPWISYSSVNYLKKFLTKDSRVLEFGSGMSTVWYSKYAGEVFSVEDYSPWYDKMSKIFQSKNVKNITYKFINNEKEYSTFMSEDKTGFDLIMVDGSYRSKCILNSAKLLRPGGIIYLDNSDKDSTSVGGDMREAERYARDFAERVGAQIIETTDLAPTQLIVQQGLMIKLPKAVTAR
jgi:predicted O-methyltransferase YrrM